MAKKIVDLGRERLHAAWRSERRPGRRDGLLLVAWGDGTYTANGQAITRAEYEALRPGAWLDYIAEIPVTDAVTPC